MGLVLAWLGRVLLVSAGEMVVRGLIGVGVGVATYKVMNSDLVKSTMASYFQASGPLYAYVGALGIDVAVTIVLSAWAGRMATTAAKAFLVKRPS